MSKTQIMKKRAVVLGATGLVGRALVDCLASSDKVDSIITLTRRECLHTSPKVINHVVDFEQLESHSALFQGDALFSCLGTTIKQAGSIKAQRRVDLDYQYKAAKLAADEGVSHYLLVSSSGANSSSSSAYFKMKGELEDRALNLPFKQISIFQPSLLLGDRVESRLGEDLASLFLPAFCRLPGLTKYRPIRGEEVAQKMLESFLAPVDGVTKLSLDQVFPSS